MKKIQSNGSLVVFDLQGKQHFIEELKNGAYSKHFVLVDENTKKYCLPTFLEWFEEKDHFQILEMPAGEPNKHLQTCEDIWIKLSHLGADRNSVLVNLGGGVVTDLGGFVACAFKRGIPFYNIPTTLLAMVDASVGGKTGVDLGGLKNQIGIIRNPKMVVIVEDWLHSLPKVELKSGFAEMLKHGLIADPAYWDELSDLKGIRLDQITSFVSRSVELKNEVVTADPFEKGTRKILNFGHTLGHAIESYFLAQSDKERLLHGEAIAIGMILEAYLSNAVTNLPSEEMEKIKTTFLSHYPKINFTQKEIKAILNLLQHDKKNRAGKVNFVLLQAIGSPVIDIEVNPTLFGNAFEYYAH